MGVVADVAGGAEFHDVLHVVREGTAAVDEVVPVVALVAEGVGGGAFGGVVGGDVLPLQERLPGRPVGALGAGAAGAGAGVVVVAVAALHGAGHRPGGDQAGDVGVLPPSRHRVEGGVARIEFQPDIALGDLAGGAGRRLAGAVGVAAQADLVLGGGGLDLRAGDGDAPHPGQGARHRAGRRIVGVRIMAIDAFHVP